MPSRGNQATASSVRDMRCARRRMRHAPSVRCNDLRPSNQVPGRGRGRAGPVVHPPPPRTMDRQASLHPTPSGPALHPPTSSLSLGEGRWGCRTARAAPSSDSLWYAGGDRRRGPRAEPCLGGRDPLPVWRTSCAEARHELRQEWGDVRGDVRGGGHAGVEACGDAGKAALCMKYGT